MSETAATDQAVAMAAWATELLEATGNPVPQPAQSAAAPSPGAAPAGPRIDLAQPPARAGDEGPEPAPEPAPQPPGPTAKPGAITEARLATLRKTFDYVKPQSPDLAIGPLRKIATELDGAAAAATQSGASLPPDALAFKKQVTDELDGLRAKAETTVTAHVADWKAKIDALPEAGPTRDSQKVLAKQINGLLGKIEPGIAQDTYLLQKVGGALSSLGTIAHDVELLKARYQSMIPQRTTTGAPTEMPPATKPQIGLNEDDGKALADAMKKVQGKMGAEQAVEPAVVEAAVALIKKGIDTVDAKRELQARKTWVAVKERYRELAKENPDAGKAYMAKMWWYRRMLVDDTMTKLQQMYNFVWGSVGSDNPESDYDLTVRTHGSREGKVVYDFKIVEEANEKIAEAAGMKGTPPGILFDTNLYAEAVAAPLTDEQQAQPAVKAMGAMKEQGQDVGALMKLRRFMEWDEFEDYKAKMLDGIADPAARKVAEKQFDEADSLYFVARSEQLMQAAGDDEEEKAKIAAIPDTPEGQKQLLEMAAHLEHDDAKSMAVNNKLYLKKMEEVRTLEGQYNTEKDAEKKAALLAKLKSLQADATFFAAEAYHSEGPLLHVVKAGQSSKLEIEGDARYAGATKEVKDAAIKEKTKEKLAGISANQMLQSFNENLGDLLKDLRHYASEPFPGLGFYRSSKYIERMCDAAGLLVAKLPAPSQTAVSSIKLGGKAPAEIKGAMAGLVDIRGEKKGFETAEDAEQEKQAYAVEEMSKAFPGVTTLPDLAKVISAFGQEINAAVRNAIAADMTAANQGAYFGGPART